MINEWAGSERKNISNRDLPDGARIETRRACIGVRVAAKGAALGV
jgi:hypothetical protein